MLYSYFFLIKKNNFWDTNSSDEQMVEQHTGNQLYNV